MPRDEIKQTPYADLPPEAFWRSGVAQAGAYGLRALWRSKWQLPQDARFATFGSCFAQHISGALRARGMAWVDGEPAPMATPKPLARAYNYGVFSARTANVYTAAQLLLLMRMVAGAVAADGPEVWTDGERWRDSLRPMIEPEGFGSQAECMAARGAMLLGLRRAIEAADVVVFTMGLTEGWESDQGQPFAACPGTLGGTFDAQRHRFVNYTAAMTRRDLEAALDLMQAINPKLRLLLTVSPVPLTATASGAHVLVATHYSKAVLRAVAGELSADREDVDYFPAYEVITGQQARHGFYAPNLRDVVMQGVGVVMEHFFAGLRLDAPLRHAALTAARRHAAKATMDELGQEALACEEVMLEVLNDHAVAD